MRLRFVVLFALAAAGCGRAASSGATASSTIALTSDDRALWVVNPDADSVTVIDPSTRTVSAEIALGPTPTVDGAGRYEPPVKPRALAILPNDSKVYVAEEVADDQPERTASADESLHFCRDARVDRQSPCVTLRSYNLQP